MLRALPANIGLGLKCLTTTNTLAYYNAELITVVKGFMMLQALPANIRLRWKQLTATNAVAYSYYSVDIITTI